MSQGNCLFCGKNKSGDLGSHYYWATKFNQSFPPSPRRVPQSAEKEANGIMMSLKLVSMSRWLY